MGNSVRATIRVDLHAVGRCADGVLHLGVPCERDDGDLPFESGRTNQRAQVNPFLGRAALFREPITVSPSTFHGESTLRHRRSSDAATVIGSRKSAARPRNGSTWARWLVQPLRSGRSPSSRSRGTPKHSTPTAHPQLCAGPLVSL